MRRNVASQNIGGVLTTVISGAFFQPNSGLVQTYVSRDGSTLALSAVASGIARPTSFGIHIYTPAQSETDYNHLLFTFVVSGAVPTALNVYTKNDSLSVQIGSLDTRAGSGFAQVNSNAITLGSLHTRVGSVDNRVALVGLNVDSLHVRVSSLSALIGTPVGANLATDVKSIQTMVDSIYGRIGQNGINLTSVAAVANVDYTSVASSVWGSTSAAALTSNIGSLHTRVSSAAVEIGSSAISLASLHTRVGSLSALIGTPVGANLATDVKSIQTMVTSIYDRAGLIQAKTDNLPSDPADHSIVIAATDAILASVSSVDVRVSSAATQIGSGFTSLGSLHTRVSSVDARVSAAGINVDSLHTRVGSLSALIGTPVGANLATDVKSIQTMVNSIYDRIGDRGINITSASVGVTLDYTAIASSVWGSVSAAALTNNVGSLHTRVASVDNRIALVGLNVDSLHIRVSSVDARVGAVGTNVDSLHTRVSSAATQVGSNAAAIGSLHTRVSSLSALIGIPVGANLSTDVKSIQTMVNSIYDRIGDRGINITSASVGVTVGDVTVGSVNSAALAQFFSRDSGKYYSDAVSGSVVFETAKNAGGASITVTDIASGVWGASSAAALRSQIDSLHTRVASVDARVAAAGTNVDSLHTRVSSVDNRVALAGINVDSLHIRTTSLDARVTAVGVNVDSLHTRVSSAATQVGSNAVSIGSLHTRVGSLSALIGVPTGASLAIDVSSIKAGTDAIKAKTDNLPSDPADESLIIAATDAIMTRIGVPIGANIATDLSSVQTGVRSLGVSAGSMSVIAGSLSTTLGSLHTRVGSVAVEAASGGVSLSSLHTRVGSLSALIGAPVGGTLATDVGSVQTGVRSLAALISGGRMIADMTAVASDSTAADHLRRGTRGTVLGGTTGDSTTSVLSTSGLTPGAVVAEQFLGRVLTFDRDTITANLRGQATVINSMSAAGIFFVASLTTAPASGNLFAIT